MRPRLTSSATCSRWNSCRLLASVSPARTELKRRRARRSDEFEGAQVARAECCSGRSDSDATCLLPPPVGLLCGRAPIAIRVGGTITRLATVCSGRSLASVEMCAARTQMRAQCASSGPAVARAPVNGPRNSCTGRGRSICLLRAAPIQVGATETRPLSQPTPATGAASSWSENAGADLACPIRRAGSWTSCEFGGANSIADFCRVEGARQRSLSLRPFGGPFFHQVFDGLTLGQEEREHKTRGTIREWERRARESESRAGTGVGRRNLARTCCSFGERSANQHTKTASARLTHIPAAH